MVRVEPLGSRKFSITHYKFNTTELIWFTGHWFFCRTYTFVECQRSSLHHQNVISQCSFLKSLFNVHILQQYIKPFFLKQETKGKLKLHKLMQALHPALPLLTQCLKLRVYSMVLSRRDAQSITPKGSCPCALVWGDQHKLNMQVL